MSPKIKNRHRLKSRDIKNIINELKVSFTGNFIDEKSSIESGEIEGIKIIFVDNEVRFMIYNNRTIFTLYGLYKCKPNENFVVVDMGAVKFVTNGADVMAPGVVDADINISENDQVWICDEQHHKPLAIGIAIMTGEQMISESKGKAVKVVHYVGDKLWNFTAKSL